MRFPHLFRRTPTRPSHLERHIRRKCWLRDAAVSVALAIAATALLWLAGSALHFVWQQFTR
jgi:hypothetical protein